MKKTNLIMKSAVALALAGVASASFAATSTNSDAALRLAFHMFGNGTNSAVDSDETLIQAKTAFLNPVDVADVATNTVTVKYTLNKGAVFGQQITNANLQAIADTSVGVGSNPSGSNLFQYDTNIWASATVLSGGQIGDNTIVIQLVRSATALGAADTRTFRFGAYKVKNLQTAGLDTVDNTVALGQEFRDVTAGLAETTAPVDIFVAKKALSAVTTATAFTALPRIQVAESTKKFTTTTGSAAKTDFTTGTLVLSQLGSLQLALDTTVNKEDGNPYDFNGGDTIALTVSADANTLKAFTGTGAGIWLSSGACAATVPAAAVGSVYLGTVNDTTGKITFALTGNTTQVTSAYNICAKANGTDSINEIKTGWAPAYNVTWFNPRYINQPISGTAFNQVLNNGITQTVPYMLSGEHADNSGYSTYLRVQNTSNMGGRVKVSCLKNSVAGLTGDISTAGTAWTEGVLATKLGAYQSALFTSANVAAACGANGAAGADFSYVRVTGEFPSMDAIQFMFNHQTNVVTQFNTNNLVTGGEGGNN